MRRIFLTRLTREHPRVIALIPAHLKFVDPKIALVGIEIPPETMPVDILRENVALKNSALQGHPLPRIHRHSHKERAHGIAGTTFGNVGVEECGPSKRAVSEKSAVVGNDELTVGYHLSNPKGETWQPVVSAWKQILLKPKLAHPQGVEAGNIRDGEKVADQVLRGIPPAKPKPPRAHTGALPANQLLKI